MRHLGRSIAPRHLRARRSSSRRDRAVRDTAPIRVLCPARCDASVRSSREHAEQLPGRPTVLAELGDLGLQVLEQDVQVANGPEDRGEPAKLDRERFEAVAEQRLRGACERPRPPGCDPESVEILRIVCRRGPLGRASRARAAPGRGGVGCARAVGAPCGRTAASESCSTRITFGRPSDRFAPARLSDRLSLLRSFSSPSTSSISSSRSLMRRRRSRPPRCRASRRRRSGHHPRRGSRSAESAASRPPRARRAGGGR